MFENTATVDWRSQGGSWRLAIRLGTPGFDTFWVSRGEGWQVRSGRPSLLAVLVVGVLSVAALVGLSGPVVLTLVCGPLAVLVAVLVRGMRSVAGRLLATFGPPPADGRGMGVTVGDMTGWHDWTQTLLRNRRAGLGEPTYEVGLLASPPGGEHARSMGAGLDRRQARDLVDQLTGSARGWDLVVMSVDAGPDAGRLAITRRTASA